MATIGSTRGHHPALTHVTCGLLLLAASSAFASQLPAGFAEEVVIGGLTQPMQAAFAPDGRIFIAQKNGTVLAFADETSSPQLLIDLSPSVHDYWDRGMLGLAVDPGFPARPYVYVLYAHNFDVHEPEAGEPRWPTNDCPVVPGGTVDGCVVNGRLSRIEVAPDNTPVGGEQVLLEGSWCAQFPSHSIGTLAFDGDGALYVTAGDGANTNHVDWGQFGGSPDSPVPANPCDDPPTGRGIAPSPPDAEGGALRAQDLRTSGDPVSWMGAVLRIDPDSGEAWPTNPRVGGDPEDDRVVAFGLRNPFRATRRPGTNEMWIGDVGWNVWEEINRLQVPSSGNVPNFGWPCYEGANRQPAYDQAELALCETLYTDDQAPAQAPYFSYRRSEPVDVDPTPGELVCSRSGGSAIAGLAFTTPDAPYPDDYDDALFFVDFSRQCIFVMLAGSDGLPDPSTRATFADGVTAAVQLLTGPDGALHYLGFASGELVRISWNDSNTTPQAVASANGTAGPLPLTVRFDASASIDPDDGATLTYEWDLDGDGAYDDSTLVDPEFIYTNVGQFTVGLRVTDEFNASSVDSLIVTAGNTPPVASITAPSPELHWEAGQSIEFAGSAMDAEDGTRPPASFHWQVILHACTDDGEECTPHTIAEFDGVSAGSFTAPDQSGMAWLEVLLSVVDDGFPDERGMAGRLTGVARVTNQPLTVELGFDTVPSGLELQVDGATRQTPFIRTTVVGSTNAVTAPDPQAGPGGEHRFLYWSDGGSSSHAITAPAEALTLTATFVFDCTDPSRCTPVRRVGPMGPPLAPFDSLQAAVDALNAGERIEVFPGSYAEALTVDRRFTVDIQRLDDGSGSPVVIDGGSGTALTATGPGQLSLNDIVLKGNRGVVAAAPTRLESVRMGPVIESGLELSAADHHVVDLTLDPGAASGVLVSADAALSLERAQIAGTSGAALTVEGTATLRNVLVHDSGTGVHVAAGAGIDVTHTTIAANSEQGIDAELGATVAVFSSVLTGNGGGDAPGLPCASLTFTASDRIDCAGQDGNISAAPQLDDSFRPSPFSPVLDAGPVPSTVPTPCVDLDGNRRWLDHDGDGVPRVDLGALERVNPDRQSRVDGLVWSSANELGWSSQDGAVRYHAYRGPRDALPTGVGPTCVNNLDDDLTDHRLSDPSSPEPGAVWVYWVTYVDGAGTESSAAAGSCADRTIVEPCP